MHQHVFSKLLHVFKRRVGHFRLDHPELGEMAAGLGFLGAEGRAESVDLAERHGGGFVIKLAGLRQVGLGVLEIVHFEQRGGAFAGRRRENGCIDEGEAVRIEILAYCADHLVAHADDGVLPLAAQPEVAMIHQKLDAVILRGDGVGIGFRHALHHFQILHVHFVAAGGALVGADLAGDNDGGFLGQVFDGLEQGFGQRTFYGHALHQAGAIAQDRKDDFAGFAKVVEPTGDPHRFANVGGCLGDVDSGWTHRSSRRSKSSAAVASENSGASFNSSSRGY